MTQIQVELQQPLPPAPLAASSSAAASRVPLWVSLLFRNPKARVGFCHPRFDRVRSR